MLGKGLYEIEQIIGKKILNRRILYHVRWKGFSSEHDSWEPSGNLGACKLLIQYYNEAHAMESSDDGSSTCNKRSQPDNDTSLKAVEKGPPAKKQKLAKIDKVKGNLNSQMTPTTNSNALPESGGMDSLDNVGNKKQKKNGLFKIKNVKENNTGGVKKKSEFLKVKFGTPKNLKNKNVTPKLKGNGTPQCIETPKQKDENASKLNSENVNKLKSDNVSKFKSISLLRDNGTEQGKISKVTLKKSKSDICKQHTDNSKQVTDSNNKQKDCSVIGGVTILPKQTCEQSTDNVESLKQSESEKLNSIKSANAIVMKHNKGVAKKDTGNKQPMAITPVKNGEPLLVDLTKSPSDVYVTSSESIEISDDEEEEDVLYSLNPDCDFDDAKEISGDKGYQNSVESKDSISSKQSVIEICDGKSKDGGVKKKKKRLSLMDSKKKDKVWTEKSDEPMRPVSPPPPPQFTTMKEPSSSPDNPDPSKPSGPDPVSPEASETYLADVPSSFPVSGGNPALDEDQPLSPCSISYKSFLDSLPCQLHPGHKGGKKGKVAPAARSGFVSRELSALSSGIGAVERRASVRASECAFRYKQIVVKKCFHFTQIWLNTQTVMSNSLNPSVIQEIISAMNSAKYDDSHLVLFSGFGPVFCSGTDLHYLLTGDRRLAARQMVERIRELTKTFITFPKPIIAAVSGAAVGLGVSLLLLCDVVYASDKASFHLPYSQLSQTPEGCSSFTLPQTLGLPSANELLFGGRKITAMEAYQLGLVSQVFWPTLMMQEVIPRAQNMAASSAKALEATKMLIRGHHRTKMELTNETECNLLLERWLSVDCQHAIEAYIANEKNWVL